LPLKNHCAVFQQDARIKPGLDRLGMVKIAVRQAPRGKAPGMRTQQIVFTSQPLGLKNAIHRGIAMSADHFRKCRVRFGDLAGTHQLS
jgi:hypothetical protein